MKDRILPISVTRDEEGYFQHPAFPEWAEGQTNNDLIAEFAQQGLQVMVRCMEDEMTIDEADARQKADNYTAVGWEPKRPDGDGWFIVSIHCANDGPCCLWARRSTDELQDLVDGSRRIGENNDHWGAWS